MRLRKRFSFLFLLMLIPLLLAGTAQAQTAVVQIIHNSPDTSLTAFDIWVDGVMEHPAVPFRTSVLDTVGVGAIIGIAYPDSQEILRADTLSLGAGSQNAIMVTGVVDTTAFPTNPDMVSRDLAFQLYEGVQTSAPAAEVGLLAFHGTPDAPSVDVRTRVTTLLFGGLQFTDYSNGYLNVPEDDHLIYVSPEGDSTNVVAAFHAPLTGLGGGTALVFASGFLANNPALPDFALLAALPDGSVISFADTTYSPLTTVQFIHNSPDTLLSTVDVYADTLLIRSAMPFRTSLVSDVLLDAEIGVAPSPSTGPQDVIKSTALDLTSGERYVLMMAGVADSLNLPSNPDMVSTGLDLLLYDGIETTAPGGQVGLRAFHGAPDAPTVDIRALLNTQLFNGLTFKEDSGDTIAVPATSYTIYVTPEGDTTNVLAAFDANFSPQNGLGVFLFASGYVTDDPGLPDFSLHGALPNGVVVTFTSTSFDSTVNVQFIHNSPDPQLAAMDVYVDGVLTLDDFRFQEATMAPPLGGLTLPTLATQIGVADSNSTGPGDILISRTLNLEPSVSYAMMAAGVVDSLGLPGNPEMVRTGLDFYLYDDLVVSAPVGEVGLLAFHGVPDAPTVDVRALPTMLLFGGLPFTGFSDDTLNVPADDYILYLTPQGEPGNLLGAFVAPLTGIPGSAAVVFASGYLASDPQLSDLGLLAALPNGSVIAFADTTFPSTVDVQFIHNAPDPQLATVDVYVDSVLTLDNFAFQSASGGMPLPIVSTEIGFADSSSTGPGDIFWTKDLSLLPFQRYLVMATGALDDSLPPSPEGIDEALDLFAFDNWRSSGFNGVGLVGAHGVPDAPRVDIRDNGTIIMSQLQYTKFDGYIQIPDTVYTFQLRPSLGPGVVLKSFTADLTGLGGDGVTLFISGYLAETDSLPDLSMFLADAQGNVVELPEVIVPAILQSSSVALRSGYVEVEWVMGRLESEERFEVLRARVPDGSFGVVEGELVQNRLQFGFRDRNYDSGATYRYRVDVLDRSSRWVLFESLPISIPALPLSLSQNLPNPLRGSTAINFNLPDRGRVRLEVFDVAGRLVTTVLDEERASGPHTVVWDGRDDVGRLVPSGMYLYRLVSGDRAVSKKLVIMR